jgi:molecular chaperone DnaJ
MNYYEILEVCPRDSQEEIKQSYRRLVKQFHPDGRHDSASHDSIISLNAAYEVLRDIQRRNYYDQQLTKSQREWRNAQDQNQ